MDEEKMLIFICAMQVASLALFTAWKAKKGKRWRNRRWWVRPVNARRQEYGAFANLFAELKEDPDLFFRYTRMNVPTFYELLEMLRPFLKKHSRRLPICPEQRLAITLRYLATGDQMLSVALAYRVGESADVADKLVVAAMCLHNFLKTKNDEKLPHQQKYCPSQFVDRESDEGNLIAGEWRDQPATAHIRAMGNYGAHRATREAYEMRNTLTSYFLTVAV